MVKSNGFNYQNFRDQNTHKLDESDIYNLILGINIVKHAIGIINRM